MITSADPFEFERAFTYDGANNVIQLDLTNEDEYGDSPGDGFVSKFFEYDELNNLTRLEEEIADGLTRITDYEYDPSDNLIRVTLPEGNAIVYEYEDARDLVVRTLAGFGSPELAVTEIEYDQNGNVSTIKDPVEVAAGGIEKTYLFYDEFDRLLRREDEESTGQAGFLTGNGIEITYDKNSMSSSEITMTTALSWLASQCRTMSSIGLPVRINISSAPRSMGKISMSLTLPCCQQRSSTGSTTDWNE